MSSLTNYSCKKCLERQEELLEEGDGSQVVCLCHDEISDEEMQQLQIYEGSSSASQIEVNDDRNNVEFVISATQSTSNNSSLLTPPLNEKIAEKMQPPSLKRKCVNFSIIST